MDGQGWGPGGERGPRSVCGHWRQCFQRLTAPPPAGSVKTRVAVLPAVFSPSATCLNPKARLSSGARAPL